MTDGGGESGRRPVLRGRQGVGRTGARLPRRTEAAPPADEAPPALPPGPSSTASDPLPAPWPDRTPAGGGAGDPLVGRTGARFDSRGRRLRRRPKREAAEDSVVQAQAVPVRQRVELGRGGTVPTPRASWSDAWWAGARWSDARPSDERPSDARPSDARPPEVRPSEVRPSEVRPSEIRWSDDEAPTAPLHLAELRSRVEGIEPRVSVRPYVRTRGRTHARSDLRLETLVSIPSPRRPMDDPEHRAIGELCDGPRSVAEVAALMGMPLGVARILIGDMADEGTLTVHRTLDRLGPGSGPDRAVMARVLRGLRAL